MDTLKPKKSKSIIFTVREGFFTFWTILAHSAAGLRPVTRFQQHFLGNWLFFPTVRTSLKSVLSSNSVFCAHWGEIIIEVVFACNFVFGICDFMLEFFVISPYISK